MFPRIERAVFAILAVGKVVAPVDVLVKMDILASKDLEDWRFGRVPYLERVIRGSLAALNRLLPILGFLCHDLNLVPSHTVYVKSGKGLRTPLRFTKTGQERLEKLYARHFVWPGKGSFHPPAREIGRRPMSESRPPQRARDVSVALERAVTPGPRWRASRNG